MQFLIDSFISKSENNLILSDKTKRNNSKKKSKQQQSSSTVSNQSFQHSFHKQKHIKQKSYKKEMNHLHPPLNYQTDFFKCKNDYKEFYVVQQSVLLSLLNNYCDIILTHQKKKSVVTS